MKDKTKELNDKLANIVEMANIITGNSPILHLIVGAVLEEGSVIDYTACVASSEMNRIDPEKEASRMVATIIKSLILFLRDALGDNKQASQLFTSALLDALSQTESNNMFGEYSWKGRHGNRYGFKRLND